MSEHPKGPNRAAGAFAGAAVAGITALGAGPATQNIPPAPSQRPPAAVAEVTLAPDGGILDPSSTKTPPKTNSDQNPKQELTVEVPGTGKHTGGRVVFGFERDNNGTLNTGEKGPEPGVPARELIPDLMPNLVIGTSSKGGGTEDDGWELKIAQTEKTIQVPVPKTESTFTEVTEEVQDVSKYPIKTPWEQDYKASPELHAEVERAIQECFDQIQQRRELGYLLTSLKIGGLSSDEGNAENPGDPMANLGQHSKLNQDLANQRGLAGIQTGLELAPQNDIDPALIQFLEGQEVLASDQEIQQIVGYAKLLGQDPLSLIQDYNRAKAEGLQPLMDKLFKGNRGIICVAEYTKVETTVVQGPDKKTVVLVPVEIEGKELQWRIEIPGEILLLPLLYIALKAGLGTLGALGGAGGGGSLLSASGRTPNTPLKPSAPPSGASPPPPKPPVAPTKRTQPNTPNLPAPKLDPPELVPLYPLSPIKDSQFKKGPQNTGLQNPQNPIQRIKQPRPHNFHGSGSRPGQPMGRSKGGNRRGKRTGSGR